VSPGICPSAVFIVIAVTSMTTPGSGRRDGGRPRRVIFGSRVRDRGQIKGTTAQGQGPDWWLNGWRSDRPAVGDRLQGSRWGRPTTARGPEPSPKEEEGGAQTKAAEP
jgi:hypothetical protein